MKRATFTLFQHQRWRPMRQLALMFIFTWGALGIHLANAQISTPYSIHGDTSAYHELTTCNGNPSISSTLFSDDNFFDGNYADNRVRRDTVEICPEDEDHYVKLVVSDFDLEEGDTLFVFDGNITAFRMGNAPVVGTGTGVGVSRGFGGWLDANCDPSINPSGCLTFMFKTDGDNYKGKGWEFWVDCAERAISFGDVSIESKILRVDDPAYGHITIPAPEIEGCYIPFPTTSDSVRLLVKNQLGMVQIDTVLTHTGAFNSIWDTFAIGSYSAEYTLLVDPTQKLLVPFSVQAPALICNDNVIIPLGSACLIQLLPDDILESPVDTITDTMYYNITVMLGLGKNRIIRTTTNHDNHGKVTYPSITVEDVRNAGMNICDATATVMIERIYYELGGIETIANNGIQRTSCQTEISFSDQSQPYISITSDIDTLIACDTTGLFELLDPRGIDNCDDEVPVSFSIKMDETDPCYNSKGSKDTTKAIITFTAVDDCGNVGKTTREVIIIRPDEKKHITKTSSLSLDCTDTTEIVEMPGIQIGAIQNGEFIVKDTITLSTEEYICGYILTMKDVEIPNTDCGRKIYRYWSVVDWCSPENGVIPVDTQLVKYTDKKAPTFTLDTATTELLEVGAFECTYDITNLPAPEATDNCSTPFVRIDSIFRIEDGLPWPVPKSLYTQLDVDSFRIRWIAEDDCHEQLVNDTLMQLVIIKDITRPTAVCTDQLNISVGSNVSVINTNDVDAGSYDACGIVKRELSRDGENFGPTVTFTCDDIKDTIQVTFRVTDIHGNTNTCWLVVHPEDKIRPICTPFANGVSYANGENLGNTSEVRVNCDEAKVAAILDRNNPTAAELAGIGGPLPAPKDNCPDAQNIELNPVVVTIGACGQDTYQRRWVARDIWGLESVDTCTQTIKIDNVEDWEIIFPEDVALTCPMTTANIDSVIIRSGHCDKLAVNVETQMFNVVEDACFKVVKTYHIINWCNYIPGSSPTHNYNAQNMPEDSVLTEKDIPNLSYITFTQIIKVDDNEGPIVVMQDTVDACILGAHDGIAATVGDSMSCGEIKTFTASAGDCVTAVGGQLSHTYKLYLGTEQDVIAQQAIEVYSSTGYEVGNEAEMLAFVLPGTYTAEFVFTDNCGNATLARKEYTFIECKKPTPYLLNGIAIELSQPSGWIDVWANDFNQGSYDNCSPQDSLDFRIWHISLGFNPPETIEGVLDSLPTAITFNCNYLGTQIVRIYVIDESLNYDYASTFVLIQDNMRACQSDENDNMIAGEITSYNGESIENVEVMVNDGSELSMSTEADGHYQFMLEKHENYTITPAKNDNPLNGVSTFDLVLISKHILGITTFDSPYKYIAADVNKSGSITAFDMVQLRQLILNINTEFPNNQSWRFIDKSYQFASDAPMGEDFAESITIENLSENLMETDFIGIKVGDVNGNASTNSLLGAEERNNLPDFHFQITDQLIKLGETVKIPVKAATVAEMEGYQFTLNFAGLDFVAIEEGIVKAENFNTKVAAKGKLTTSWNGTAANNDLLYTLIFKANMTGYLHDFLAINSDYTAAEAYHQSGDLMNVAFDFQADNQPLVFNLEQNAPNPFKEETIIGFTLPKADIATLKIMDIQGKILRIIRNNYDKGYNQISLDATTLGATGVLHYQLEAGNFLANKKMIIIE